MSRTSTAAQSRHLTIAGLEEHRLHRIIRHRPLTAFDWLRAAALVSSIAAHVEQVAVLAESSTAAAATWRRSATTLHATAARFELWAAVDVEEKQ